MSRCPSPSCGSDRAYIGLNTVECPITGCRHFSPKLQAELQPTSAVSKQAEHVRNEMEEIYHSYKASLPPVVLPTQIDDMQDAIRYFMQPPGPTIPPTLPQEGLTMWLTPDGVDGKVWRDKSGHGNDLIANKDIEAAWYWDRMLTPAETKQVYDYVHHRWGIKCAGPEHKTETVDPQDPLAPWKPDYGTTLVEAKAPRLEYLADKVFDVYKGPSSRVREPLFNDDHFKALSVEAQVAPYSYTVSVQVQLPATIDFIPIDITVGPAKD